MTHELLGQLASQKMSFRQNVISAAQLGELIDMVQQKIITGEIPVQTPATHRIYPLVDQQKQPLSSIFTQPKRFH